MRADRLLSILLLLQVHRRMTTRQLAEQLEVSPRTIHRDMDALSGAGVPVTGQRGQGGGWELLGAYRTDLTGLTAEESQTIFLDALPPSLSALGLDEAARSARIKLLAALTSNARTNVEYTRQRLYIDPTGWSQSSDSVELLPVIQDGIWMNRVLRLTYRRADGKVVEREVHPLGLVAKGQTWYLVGAVDVGMRTYRGSRIVSAERSDADAARPDDFDLRAYWQQSMGEFQSQLPRYDVRMEISPAILPRVRFGINFARIEETGEPLA
ncbi:MAG: helix-turn-helix transcriptional regulator, partial [Geminicoccales bacterium]